MNRQNAIQQIRKRLKEKQPSIGSWMQIPHPSIAEIMGQSGYDWIAVDLEHGSISHAQLPDLFRALELGNTLPLVRLAEGTAKECKQVLDAGSGGVIVPMIESAEQLERVLAACCWPPAGIRGVGYSRANLFGKHFQTYSDEAQAPLMIAQIEHIRAVENLSAILNVVGLDGILVGPYDLSASMGLTGQFDSDFFQSTMQQILHICQEQNKPAGLHVVQPSLSELNLRIEEGYQLMAYSIDAVFLNESAAYSIHHPLRTPRCGSSDKRNKEYEDRYTSKEYFLNLIDKKQPVIFDIGAHKGESIEYFKIIYPEAIIYSFEPISDNYNVLIEKSKLFEGSCFTYNMAVAECSGYLNFYCQDISHIGSLLKINIDSKDSLGYASKAKNKKTKVPVISIDDFCAEHNIDQVDLVKIDVQGYEEKVLEGAIKSINKINCLIIEISFYDFYEHYSSLFHIENILKSTHKIWDISKISKNPKNLRTDWVEIVYRKRK